MKNSLLILFLFICNIAISQVMEEWIMRYNGSGDMGDSGEKMSIDNSGNIIVAGNVTNDNRDYAIFKYSSNGDLIWIRIYDGANGNDHLHDMVIDKFGNVYVTGSSYKDNEDYNYCTIKYSSLGELLWVSTYNGTSNDYDTGSRIAVDSSGNVYVTGEGREIPGGDDCVTIKYDSLGQIIWLRKFDNNNYQDEASSISVDRNNNVYISGSTIFPGRLDDYLVVKYDSSGVQQWAETYNGTANSRDFGRRSKIDDSGNVYVAGYATNIGTGIDVTTIKYNTDGIIQWIQVYNGFNSSDIAEDIYFDKDFNFYVSLESIGPGTGRDFVVLKYSRNGNLEWVSRYDYGLNDIPQTMTMDAYKNIYVSGYGNVPQTGYDFVTYKLDSMGQMKWSITYDKSGNWGDYPQAIAVDNVGSVYVTGISDFDFLTIKYSQLTGVQNQNSFIPIEFNLSQNYPNPFNPSTKISYELRSAVGGTSYATLKIYDVLGNEVATLVNETKPAGSYEVEFDGSFLPSGIYFYNLEVDGKIIDTKRMILLK